MTGVADSLSLAALSGLSFGTSGKVHPYVPTLAFYKHMPISVIFLEPVAFIVSLSLFIELSILLTDASQVCQLVAPGNNSAVTCLCMSPNKRQIAAG